MTLPALRDRACPSCGSRDGTTEVACADDVEAKTIEQLRPYWYGLHKEKHFFPYKRCAQCALLYNPVFFDDSQLADLYSNMPPNMELVTETAISDTQRGYFAAAANQNLPSGDYLEIGPDVGHLVGQAVEHGGFEHFWLFEPNRAVHASLRAAAGDRPSTILTDMTDLSPVPDRSVSLAVMIHVLDHLLDPLAMLKTVAAKLKPGGRLLIVTHNEGSLLRRALGRRWPPFCLQHPLLYNPETIERLLVHAGFGKVDVSASTNHFPIAFLARQAAQAAGVALPEWVPLPRRAIGLRLGNILTLAQAGS